MYFFGSDQHFGHRNILLHTPRPYPNIEDHDIDVIKRHNAVVSDGDEYWGLGDIGFRCPAHHVRDCLSQMNGHLNIILGNHDKPLRQALKKGLMDALLKKDKVRIIGSVDPTEAMIKTISVEGRRLVLCHYSLRSWPGAFRGAIHLYGHSHEKCPSYFKSFNVCLDQNQCMPFAADDIFDRADSYKDEFRELDV